MGDEEPLLLGVTLGLINDPECLRQSVDGRNRITVDLAAGGYDNDPVHGTVGPRMHGSSIFGLLTCDTVAVRIRVYRG